MHSLIMIGALSNARMFQVEWTAVVLLILLCCSFCQGALKVLRVKSE